MNHVSAMLSTLEHPGKARWVLLLVISAVLLWDSAASIHRGIADFVYYPVKIQFRAWDKGKLPEAEKEYLLMHQQVDHALEWDPTNPLLLEARGRITDSRSQVMSVESSSDENMRSALDDFSRSTRLMPSSPWAWRNIALMKARLGEYDQELEQYLLQAHTLAPESIKMHYTMVEIGLAGWGAFSSSMRQQVVASIHELLQYSNSHKVLIEFAERFRKKKILCSNIDSEKALQQYCTE